MHLSIVFVLRSESERDMMHHLNNNKKKKKSNILLTAATLFTVAFFVVAVFSPIITTIQSAEASAVANSVGTSRAAPTVVSGDNIYVAWWTNNTENGNEEVMFRASTDGGATFGDKINLSNTTDADSWRVEIAGEGENVIVSWWETNQTSDTPVARVSNDAGQSFDPMLRLAANGTIGSTEEGGETVEEEAVGEAEVAE
jgi:hypothetical protein